MPIIAAMIALIIIIVIIWVRFNKKTNKVEKQFDSMEAKDKATLRNSPVTQDPHNPQAWNQLAQIISIKTRGGRQVVRAMWYNTRIHNDSYNDFAMAQFMVPHGELAKHHVADGDIVSLHLDIRNGAHINYTD